MTTKARGVSGKERRLAGEERVNIETLLRQGESYRSVAQTVGRSVYSVFGIASQLLYSGEIPIKPIGRPRTSARKSTVRFVHSDNTIQYARLQWNAGQTTSEIGLVLGISRHAVKRLANKYNFPARSVREGTWLNG